MALTVDRGGFVPTRKPAEVLPRRAPGGATPSLPIMDQIPDIGGGGAGPFVPGGGVPSVPTSGGTAPVPGGVLSRGSGPFTPPQSRSQPVPSRGGIQQPIPQLPDQTQPVPSRGGIPLPSQPTPDGEARGTLPIGPRTSLAPQDGQVLAQGGEIKGPQNQTLYSGEAAGNQIGNAAGGTGVVGDQTSQAVPNRTGGANPAQTATSQQPAGPTFGPGQFQGRIPANDAEWGALNHGQAVEGLPGYSWYHTGSGWSQAPTGADPKAGPVAGANPAQPQGPMDLKAQLAQKMASLMNQGPASLEDEDLKGVVNAHRTGEQRAFDRSRAMLAERNAQQGRTGGANETDLLGLAQGRGEREASFGANLLRDETMQRRDQLMNIMAMAGNQISETERNAITKELGMLDAEMKRLGISEGGRQFDADLGFRNRNLDLDEAFRRAGLASSEGQAGAARGQAQSQFETTKAQQQAQWEAEMQMQQLLALLDYYGAG